jgi:hypothetical protein
VSTCLLLRSWWATRPKRTGVSYSLLQDELETGYHTLNSTAINYKTRSQKKKKKLIKLPGDTKSFLEAKIPSGSQELVHVYDSKIFITVYKRVYHYFLSRGFFLCFQMKELHSYLRKCICRRIRQA